MTAESTSAHEERGIVTKILPNGIFQVRLRDGRYIVAHLAERLRLNPIRLFPGDEVLVQVTKNDPSRGRILRKKEGPP